MQMSKMLIRQELAERAASLGLDAGIVEKLASFIKLVQAAPAFPKWQQIAETLAHDSLEYFALPEIRSAYQLADICTGAGFPGLVLAICLPDRQVTLVDMNPVAVAFLRSAVIRLDLRNASVIEGPAQSWVAGRGTCDVVTVRNSGRPDSLPAWAAPLLRPGGTAVFWYPELNPQSVELGRRAATDAGLQLLRVVSVRLYRPGYRNLYVYTKIANL